MASGKPMSMAYWFMHDHDRIHERFSVRDIDTPKAIEDWNAGKIPVALIHPASARHGLNLQSGGSALVWFSMTWFLELYQQVNDRLWRLSGRGLIEMELWKKLEGTLLLIFPPFYNSEYPIQSHFVFLVYTVLKKI